MLGAARTTTRPAPEHEDNDDPAGDVVIRSSWGHFIIIDVEALRQALAEESRRTKIEWDERIDRMRIVTFFHRAVLRSTVPPQIDATQENHSSLAASANRLNLLGYSRRTVDPRRRRPRITILSRRRRLESL